MENLEQKSKSENTEISEEIKVSSPSQISVEPLAQQWQAYIPCTYTELREVFDTYWVENEQLLLKKYPLKMQKKKGGSPDSAKAQAMLENSIKITRLYRPVLFDIFVKKMDERENRSSSILFTESLELLNFKEGEDCPLVATFYYRPELVFDGEVNFECVAPKFPTWEARWEAVQKQAANKHKVLTPYEGSDIRENHSVLLDINASADGVPDQAMSFRLQWLDLPSLRIESLKREILGHRKGDLFETTYTFEDPKSPKEVKAQIKIHELQTITMLPPTELAKKEGYDTEAEWSTAERQKYDGYRRNLEQGTIADHVINGMLQKVVIPPAPVSWMEANAKTMLDRHIASNNNNKTQAMKVLGLSDEEDLMHFFRSEVHQNYVKDLVVRKYAKIYQLQITEQNLLDKVLEHMHEMAIWREPKR